MLEQITYAIQIAGAICIVIFTGFRAVVSGVRWYDRNFNRGKSKAETPAVSFAAQTTSLIRGFENALREHKAEDERKFKEERDERNKQFRAVNSTLTEIQTDVGYIRGRLDGT